MDAAAIGGFLQLATAQAPSGEWRVRTLSAPTAKGLWHSLPYADAEAFDAIVAWINERLNDCLDE
jgi:hypothetical protein